jgi:HEAT repeat protein
MRSLPQIAVLAAAIALLPACGKNEETPAAKANTSAAAQQQAADPFQRNGELLSINVDTMPRAAFVAKLSELTGAKITVEGDNNQTVTLHIADGSLRKVLSMAMADVPYTISMQFANLQDSFPVSVSVTRYHAANATQPQPVAGNAPQASLAAMLPPGAVNAAIVQSDDDEPDLQSMSPDEQLKYFLAQDADSQTSIIFDMEPTKSDISLMNKLIVREDISGEVKQEILDSLSTAEYEDAGATIRLALDAKDPEVAAKAAEVLSSVGSEADIPALKATLEKTDNDDVRTAINDAIETLEP